MLDAFIIEELRKEEERRRLADEECRRLRLPLERGNDGSERRDSENDRRPKDGRGENGANREDAVSTVIRIVLSSGNVQRVGGDLGH